MNENNSKLDLLKHNKKPVVTEGFFDQFYANLMNEIDTESGLLGQLSKREKPKLPAGYFESSAVILGIAENEEFIDQLQKTSPPTIPLNFFAEFPDKIMHELVDSKQTKERSSRVVPIWLSVGISAIAASLVLYYSVFNSTEEIETNVAIAESSEEIHDAYLTYLDEDEIIDYMIESDIEFEEETTEFDPFEDYSAEEIEEYYLELL